MKVLERIAVKRRFPKTFEIKVYLIDQPYENFLAIIKINELTGEQAQCWQACVDWED